ncbi:hypothetical protein Y032_0028g1820 [Ancylostoma ceylanicum]|uniref:Uncharacterized protein n=1 Tax=Ancylostoma ceylanicum TaxID=53326 RepID=A0A016UT27_9BILA|nr:hypothetical protein Y032_0028g1820 [Ancylostoma ceylanicum]
MTYRILSLKGSVSPRFACWRYPWILDLLAMLSSKICGKRHESDENPVFWRVHGAVPPPRQLTLLTGHATSGLAQCSMLHMEYCTV